MDLNMKKIKISKAVIYLVVLMYALFCLVPFLMVLGGSFESENEIQADGYKIIPKTFSLQAYKILSIRKDVMITGYTISIIVTVVGTALSVLICSMLAYRMSVKHLKYRKFISVYSIITMLFSGGMVPWYIVCVNYLHLKDNIFALIIPYLCNAFNVFLIRNYFQSLPDELYESAKIDGAGNITIFYKIAMPLSKPVLATVGLFIALMYWNDWYLGVMLVDNRDIQPLQLMLRSIVSNIMFLRNSPEGAAMLDVTKSIPAEGIKLATCVVTIGPIVFLYPFVQKYFVKGIMIGAVKG